MKKIGLNLELYSAETSVFVVRDNLSNYAKISRSDRSKYATSITIAIHMHNAAPSCLDGEVIASRGECPDTVGVSGVHAGHLVVEAHEGKVRVVVGWKDRLEIRQTEIAPA